METEEMDLLLAVTEVVVEARQIEGEDLVV